ncbi:MAG: cell division protein FtsZ [Akkermansiaceae bacterium]
MISYERNPQQAIPESSVKIIGLGGAGANMLDRVALDGLTGAEMLSINTDMRTLMSSVAESKIQIGKNLTKGLGTGGDPELGLQAIQEDETEIREAIRGQKMIFICVGLGGGTGSGAAPLITRIAREEDAFVVVFATMPFAFEGQRRRTQAETALNELAVLAHALITFDNGRMGELVLAKKGVHEAFSAADRMISEAIKAVTRLVVRPGLINVGLDDLMTALRTTRSRCLFGSGIAEGENRSHLALENALTSPLLDKGGLLRDSTSVLVHICGGESLTLYEIELLMQKLSKFIPDTAHVLFGAAVDPAMGDSLSVTVVSALPEDKLNSRNETKLSQPLPAVEPPVEPKLIIQPTPKLETILETPEEIDEDEPAEENESSQETLETGSSEALAEDEVTEILESIQEDEVAESAAPEKTEEPTLSAADEETEEESTEDTDDGLTSEAAPTNVLQPELELNGAPKGRFEGEAPNIHDGEDLDIPPFLRKKRR